MEQQTDMPHVAVAAFSLRMYNTFMIIWLYAGGNLYRTRKSRKWVKLYCDLNSLSVDALM